MKIAVSGAHRTGKTTLIDELAASLSAFTVVDEPYWLLEEEGHAFAEIPDPEDFELQLERSIRSIVESEGDCLFDRCPLDFVAYLTSLDASEAFDLRHWLPRVEEAVQRLDLVVFVPIEDPDRVGRSDSEDGRLRSRVDEELRDLVLRDPWSLDVPVIEVAGSPGERARQVLARVGGAGRNG